MQPGELAEQRRARDFDQMISRIEFGNDPGVAERADRPHDRGGEHAELEGGADDRLNVAIARAQDGDDRRQPDQIHADQDKAGYGQKHFQVRFDLEYNRDRYVDDDGVQKYDEISPHHTQHINRIGQLDLLDNAIGIDEGDAAVIDRRRHEAPNDIAD